MLLGGKSRVSELSRDSQFYAVAFGVPSAPVQKDPKKWDLVQNAGAVFGLPSRVQKIPGLGPALDVRSSALPGLWC